VPKLTASRCAQCWQLQCKWWSVEWWFSWILPSFAPLKDARCYWL